MTSFDERQKGYENKYIHDQEKDFKVRSRRNKLLGIWAAGKMSLNEQDTKEYAASLVADAVDGFANETVLAKILNDLAAKKVEISENKVKEEMERLLVEARKAFE